MTNQVINIIPNNLSKRLKIELSTIASNGFTFEINFVNDQININLYKTTSHSFRLIIHKKYPFTAPEIYAVKPLHILCNNIDNIICDYQYEICPDGLLICPILNNWSPSSSINDICNEAIECANSLKNRNKIVIFKIFIFKQLIIQNQACDDILNLFLSYFYLLFT